MNGLVSGGWNFVWAAYAITGLVLAAYAIRTFKMGSRTFKMGSGLQFSVFSSACREKMIRLARLAR